MNIDEKIKELEEKLEEIKKENKFKRWRTKLGFRYFYICDDGTILDATDFYNMSDDYRYATGNYFETEAEALRYKQNRLTYQQLKDIALGLNKGQVIDWQDFTKPIYSFMFNYTSKKFKLSRYLDMKPMGIITCLDEKFLDIALEEKEIGEEKLKQLLEWGI